MTEPRYFEDFHVGDRVRTPGRTITETDFTLFGAFAGSSPAACLAPLAISTGLLALAGDRGMPRSGIALLSLEHVRFVAPAKAGDTIHVEAEVVQTMQVDRVRGLIAVTLSVKNQRGEDVVVYTSKLLTGRRPSAAEPSRG